MYYYLMSKFLMCEILFEFQNSSTGLQHKNT